MPCVTPWYNSSVRCKAALEKAFFQRKPVWKNLGITVQSSACTACELPCVEKSPGNNSSFPTAAAFPLRLHVLPAGKLTNCLLLLLMWNNCHPLGAGGSGDCLQDKRGVD